MYLYWKTNVKYKFTPTAAETLLATY